MENLNDLLPYLIGVGVVLVTVIVYLLRKSGSDETPGAVFLNKERVAVPLIERKDLSHDTRLYRFGLPKPNDVFGLPIGKHIKVFCPTPKGIKEGEWNGRPDVDFGKPEIERKYTPTSSDKNLGYFDLFIKVYHGGVLEQFSDGGKMSLYFETLKVGDTIDVQGPFGLYEYLGKGTFKIMRKTREVKKVGMLAGGTGITPMLQVITAIMSDDSDATEVSLIFANKTEDDILVRDMLEKLAAENPGRFHLHYTLDAPPENWTHSKGFISEEMIREHMPAPADDTLILMCGPPPMIKFACKPNLEKVGHASRNVIEF
ncbi:NADH-cytochrome b5 reductase 1 [Hondaea fermentalgiana]|uniref:NADH-cytochrome b5 reductase n=1 Tax=Hondaea fermentalgiana TaxID=2315210 RepID=A0A2R5GNS8_9STRA|nr:NADH-cytochrome b5 reductase 1 [Hondaea fermentalgiana]|eukprot:GBG32547.1 NADH-cytochrome b5 reductase 1 [Hondaea fermentalgiana]